MPAGVIGPPPNLIRRVLLDDVQELKHDRQRLAEARRKRGQRRSRLAETEPEEGGQFAAALGALLSQHFAERLAKVCETSGPFSEIFLEEGRGVHFSAYLKRIGIQR